MLDAAGAAPPLPDFSFLRDLPPNVASQALFVVLVIAVLIYVGPPLRAWLEGRVRRPVPVVEPAPDPAVPEPLPAVMARTDDMTERYIARLESELAAAEADAAGHEQEARRHERAKEGLRVENALLLAQVEQLVQENRRLRGGATS